MKATLVRAQATAHQTRFCKPTSSRSPGACLLAGLAAGMVLGSPLQGYAADQLAAGPSSITIVAVAPSVSDALAERDEMMRWKCNGVNMYDCDGERAEKAEAQWEEFRATFKQQDISADQEEK